MNSVKEKSIRDQEELDRKQKQMDKDEDDLLGHDIKAEFDDNIIDTLENELRIEDEKAEKALKHMYKYKEAYGNVFFTDIPLKKMLHGYSKDQITQSNFDKSTILKELTHLDQFLGEMQYAFILFYVGQNYEGFEQWKKMVYLICHSEKAVYLNREIFINFIPVIYEQLDQLPNDFFDESPGGIYFENFSENEQQNRSKNASLQNNFIVESLNTFYEICMSEPENGEKVSKKIKSRIGKLKKMMQEKFDIDISTEEERLDQLIVKSKDISARIHLQNSDQDGNLYRLEEQMNNRMDVDYDNDNDSSANINENTFDDEINHNANKISKQDIEILKRQLAIEGDEYMP